MEKKQMVAEPGEQQRGHPILILSREKVKKLKRFKNGTFKTCTCFQEHSSV